MEKVIKVNKMENTPIFKLLISMSLPMIISMFIQSLYNLVDSIYIGKFSNEALTAVGLAFPLQNLIVAFGVGIGVGINAILSRALGAKDFKKASDTARNGIVIVLAVAILFSLIATIITPTYMRSLSDNENVIAYGIEYLTIINICCIGWLFAITFERLLQSTGKTIYVMIVQASGAIINIILDYFLIFTCNLGVAGAALATVIGQWVSALLGLLFNIFLNKEISISFKEYKIDFKMIKEILLIGIPSTIMSAVASLLTFLFNLILKSFHDLKIPGTDLTYGEDPKTVFGLYFKLNGIFFMPIFGLNNGLVPIIAYNYGAKRKDKIYQVVKYGRILALIMMGIGTILFMFLPEQLIALFAESSEDSARLALTGVNCLRIISLSFIIAAINIIFSSLFQALGNGFYSMVISFVRQLIVLLPVAFLLSLTKQLDSVWYSYIIAEVVALGCSFYFYKRIKRNKIENM